MSERVIARKASGMVLKEAGEEVKYPMAYIADPEAPSVSEVVEVLDKAATQGSSCISDRLMAQIESLIARLEGK